MRTLIILEAFTGFPAGTDASARSFAVGEVVELEDDFASLIIAKGHATEQGSPVVSKPVKKEDRA